VLITLLAASCPWVSAQATDAPEAESPAQGVIRGQVRLPDEVSFDSVEAVLLSSEWALLWRGEVQQRLDLYSQTYKAAIARDPALFPEISRAAHREATVYVLARMQAQPGYPSHVTEISRDGHFEFPAAPFGDYTIVVVARQGSRGMIWTESMSLASPISSPIVIENRIQ
jgi:hypothetical protein